MRVLFSKRLPWILIGVLLFGFSAVFIIQAILSDGKIEKETGKVEQGDVSVFVTVSGVIHAEDAAELAFPQNGIVKNVSVDEGDFVTEGQVLASLGQESLIAEYNTALANLQFQEAAREELVEGPRAEARTVRDTNVAIAEKNLARTKEEQTRLVENARRALLSAGLEALPVNKESNDVAPTISGTYTCQEEGMYILSVFRSNARSGYSYRLSGLESGTESAYTDHPAALGECGLSIQFDEDEKYENQDWVVTVPNTRSSLYLTNLNAYDLALQHQTNTIEAAEQALELAKSEQTLEYAAPRSEALGQADASVAQARAQLASIEAQIADFTIRAPYDGLITNVDIILGEVGGQTRTITMVKEGDYELQARIPEIDITKISVDDPAEVVFDAKESEVVNAHIAFISPLSTEIDGVAYYEAILTLDETPEWMLEGMNADIDIVVERVNDVAKIPIRFLEQDKDTYRVNVLKNKTIASVSAEVGIIGNDGFAEIKNLTEGTTIVAP